MKPLLLPTQHSALSDKLTQRRALRKDLTVAEAALWRAIKNSQLGGFKFRRQHSIGPFIVDFYCPAVRLVVELDGAKHFTAAGSAADDRRTAYLNQQGLHVLRFENKLIWAAFNSVTAAILATCQERMAIP